MDSRCRHVIFVGAFYLFIQDGEMEFKGLRTDVEFGREFRESEFTFSHGMIPLNHGAYGAVPKRIQAVQLRYLAEMNAHPDLWYRQNAFKYWKQSVQAAAEFFHCDSHELVFVNTTTEGINTILKSYDFREGDCILCTSITYGAVTLTVRNLAAKVKAIKTDVLEVSYPLHDVKDVLRLFEDYLRTHPSTKIVILDHISSPSSVLMPIKTLSEICHKYGALVVVDGAHGPGQVPIDLTDLGVDFYAGNFHKWLFTPRGCALLYINRKHQDWLKPLVTSWWTDKSLTEQFFMAGSRDHIPFICAKYALEFCDAIGGMDCIMSYCSQLASEAQDYLVNLFQTERLAIPREMEPPHMKLILLPEIKGTSTDRAAMENLFMDFWKSSNIQIQMVPVQGRIYWRVSASIYNCMDDYRKCGDALLQHINRLNNT